MLDYLLAKIRVGPIGWCNGSTSGNGWAAIKQNTLQIKCVVSKCIRKTSNIDSSDDTQTVD